VGDKSTQMILTALSRAAASPGGVPLHGSKTVPGLFPTTAAGKQAAQRCQEDGLLCLAAPTDVPSDGAGGTATLVKRKTAGYPMCILTEKGLSYLLSRVSPRPVLEDFVRALEARQKQADELLSLARQMQQSIEAMKASADKVLQQTCRAEAAPDRGGLKTLFAGFLQESDTPADAKISAAGLHDALLAELNRWQTAGASEDCPLPHLFRQLPARTPAWSIGQFHDALRQLHDHGAIYLHPWTGPLYDIPEPPYALLIGHEIAYYASVRK
jgi:hypothetical protein